MSTLGANDRLGVTPLAHDRSLSPLKLRENVGKEKQSCP